MHTQSLPGQLYSVTQQCELLTGAGAAFCGVSLPNIPIFPNMKKTSISTVIKLIICKCLSIIQNAIPYTFLACFLQADVYSLWVKCKCALISTKF